MDGLEALKIIKKISPKLPIVALTAFGLKHKEKEFIAKGFDAHVAKPITTTKSKKFHWVGSIPKVGEEKDSAINKPGKYVLSGT